MPDDDETSPEQPALDEKLTALERQLDASFGPRWAYRDMRTSPVGAEVFVRYATSEMGREVVSGLVLLSEVITADMLRRVPLSALEQDAGLRRVHTFVQAELAKLPPLERTKGQDPDEFSQVVARHYKFWAALTANPAAAMADENDIKAATVHTWIREARLRGHLPPAGRRKSV